ncbi:MAG: CAP domain-containing protein [Bacteroidetes bacterium]|nr:CAP domain-containing protein [Bacteroidota bacterium]MBS1940939.1 CAP domain-containing protein [Bacteroidota bacterium]
MKALISLFMVVPLIGAQPHSAPFLDRSEAVKAFNHLNDIRKQPVRYCQQLKFSPVQVVPRPALIWNDMLARVAEHKALDMAQRNYFAHVDPDGFGINHYLKQVGYDLDPQWLRDPKANNFESIQAGCMGGKQAIDCLIIDYGVPSKGHRTHLLGVGDWNASLVDIGIGYVRSDSTTAYPTYTCVIIAKHR